MIISSNCLEKCVSQIVQVLHSQCVVCVCVALLGAGGDMCFVSICLQHTAYIWERQGLCPSLKVVCDIDFSTKPLNLYII